MPARVLVTHAVHAGDQLLIVDNDNTVRMAVMAGRSLHWGASVLLVCSSKDSYGPPAEHQCASC